MGELTLSAPALLNDGHRLDGFSCGVASLDDWLKRRARPNQFSGASRVYVVAAGDAVAGYYALASGALALNEAAGSVRRNMPDPIPMAVLGRLAVDRAWMGRGLGAALLRDAVLRTGQAASILGIRGMMVHAISDEARAFHERHGFIASRTQPMLLILSLKRGG